MLRAGDDVLAGLTAPRAMQRILRAGFGAGETAWTGTPRKHNAPGTDMDWAAEAGRGQRTNL
jgi:hypothetical protein